MEGKKYTREDIEALKNQDPETLTPYERGLANLKPTKPGERRNPNGRGKGVPNWSTRFQKLMGDEEFLATVVNTLPKNWDGIVAKHSADVIAAGLITLATQGVAKAISENRPLDENTLKLIDRIKNIGYGDKITHELDEPSFFDRTQITFNVVPDRKKDE